MLIRKKTEPDYMVRLRIVISTLLWYLFICEVFLFSLAMVFGRGCGYKITFIAFGCVGAIIAGAIVAFILIVSSFSYLAGK
ncbi:MAG: hypothetical protein JW915_06735 [Chitinispirillaceae bacterium]|nr:hypothetical protein [Chitinispirillaceae bacterium]